MQMITQCTELNELCSVVRGLIAGGKYIQCEKLLCRAMAVYPHAPQPHNLFGILLEKEGDHASAMKHFRAAEALDASYRPAAENLKTYGTFYSRGICAFDENDCRERDSAYYTMSYDSRRVGHVVRRD